MYSQLTLDDWMSFKQSLAQDLTGVSESFVRIGWKLRQIEEQKLYEKDGYESIADFAKAEYDLSASTVSRFIAINKRYSIDGNSEKLRPEYERIGSSKLSEMLALPESDLTMVTEDTTREQIRELKSFNKQADGAPEPLVLVIKTFFGDNETLLEKVYKAETLEEKIAAVVPTGSRSYRNGRYFLMFGRDKIKIKQFGGEPSDMSWSAFFNLTRSIFGEELPREEQEVEQVREDIGRDEKEEAHQEEQSTTETVGSAVPEGIEEERVERTEDERVDESVEPKEEIMPEPIIEDVEEVLHGTDEAEAELQEKIGFKLIEINDEWQRAKDIDKLMELTDDLSFMLGQIKTMRGLS